MFLKCDEEVCIQQIVHPAHDSHPEKVGRIVLFWVSGRESVPRKVVDRILHTSDAGDKYMSGFELHISESGHMRMFIIDGPDKNNFSRLAPGKLCVIVKVGK